VCCSVLQCVAACCRVLQRVGVLQCVAMCCNVLQCVAVIFSECVLQCVAYLQGCLQPQIGDVAGFWREIAA